jgi:hypothetical protein
MSKIDPATTSVQVNQTTQRQTAAPPATPFSQVLTTGANVLLTGAAAVTGVVGGPVLAAAVREAGGQLLGSATGGGGGATGYTGGAAGAAAGAPGADAGVGQALAMQRESQSFSIQLLQLQQNVQDENRRFTTISNVLKSSHDTAKAAVGNIRS